MKAIASLALAGAIAATSLATTTTAADAGGKHWKYNNYYYGKHYPRHYSKHHRKGGNPAGALAAGALLGFAVGALATPHYYAPPPRVYYRPPPPPAYPAYGYTVGPQANAHVSWCYSRYRSYNVQYNTWVGFDGLVHECVSPYPY